MASSRLSPATLRRHYEATLDGRFAERYAGASFDEYLALVRLHHPNLTTKWAVEAARRHGRPDLADHPFLPEDPPEPYIDLIPPLAELAQHHQLLRLLERAAVDLREHIDPSTRALECVHGTISGWEGLRQAKDWLEISLSKCRSEAVERLEPPVDSAVVALNQVDGTCLSSLLLSTRARALDVRHAAPFDLRSLRQQTALEMLILSAPVLHGARGFSAPRLRELRLSGADLEHDEAMIAMLTSNAVRLERLHLSGEAGFSPSRLPAMNRLRLLRVVADRRFRDEWLEYAIAHDRVGVGFSEPLKPSKVHYEIAAELDDADVLRVTKGKTLSFELHRVIEADRAGAIAHSLTAAARAAKRRVKWSVDGGLALVSAADLESCRWANGVVASASTATARPSTPVAPRAAPKRAKPVPSSSSAPSQWFLSWEGELDARLLAAARAIMDATARDLALLGKDATSAQQRAVLESCIVAFNELDENHGRFIQSIEAEGIVAAFETLVAKTNLAGKPDLADEWRDW